MNTNILKQISILSLFLGGALGAITSIPYIDGIAFWILMCLSAPIIILFMIKMEMLDIQTVKESIVIGSIIGFVSFIGFSIIYIPITVLLIKLFNYASNYGMAVTLSQASFLLIVVFVLFVSVLSATINAFSGFLTYYGIDLYKMLNKKDDSFNLENYDDRI